MDIASEYNHMDMIHLLATHTNLDPENLLKMMDGFIILERLEEICDLALTLTKSSLTKSSSTL